MALYQRHFLRLLDSTSDQLHTMLGLAANLKQEKNPARKLSVCAERISP